MASMWQKTMHYLGLGPDDAYDDEPQADQVQAHPEHSPAPEAAEAAPGAVRTLTRERERPPEPVAAPVARPRPGVVRSITAHPATAKPHTIAPTSFDEAQELGDRYLAGTPVILNLQGVDRDLSRRLIDFASGLCYGLRGQMERVGTGMYLMTPSNVEVSPEERRRLQERTS